MKKIILATLLSVFCLSGVFAQIQDKILGVEIGSTTDKELVEMLTNKHLTYKLEAKGGLNAYSANNVTFSNVNWKEAGFIVSEGKVVGVMFDDDNDKNSADMAIINEALKSKYKDYLVQDMGDMFSIYKDNKMALLFINYNNNTALVYILFDYIQQFMSKYMNEL